MAYRSGNREQQTLLPPSIEDYVPEDAPVRAYDAMINAMDMSAMGFTLDPHKVGNSQYHPASMLKLLVYGYSYGIRSSRKLERECHYNLSFIWLIGGLKPDHKTVAEFRRNNKVALKNVLKQCAQICIELNLIEGNIIFIDGTRMRANASMGKSLNRQKTQEMLAVIDNRIDELLTEIERIDEDEASVPSLVQLSGELKNQKTLKSKIESLVQKFNLQDKTLINATDSDCSRMHSRQGSHAGYNAQIAVDDKYGFIISSDVTSNNNDLGQFSTQVEEANKTLKTSCKIACADAGYYDSKDIAKIHSQNIEVIMPSKDQASQKQPHEFDKSCFTYDALTDTYTCPEGNTLKFQCIESRRGYRRYAGGKMCVECRHFVKCASNKRHGRTISRLPDEETVGLIARHYELPKSQEIFRHRKSRVEHPFGHIKRNLGAGHFLLRGLAGVRAEMSLLGTCFNIQRIITLLGINKIKAAL